MKFIKYTPFLLLLFNLSLAKADVSQDLAYPSDKPTALEIAQQVFFVNHMYSFNNYGITKKGNLSTVIIGKPKNKKASFTLVERFINNDYKHDASIKSRDLTIFRSGKLNGTGLLITDYDDDDKSQSFTLWLPALRKTRYVAQPAPDDSWGGTDFTYGDVLLRKPQHETHEILDTVQFKDCLDIIFGIKNKSVLQPPKPACQHKGKEVYRLKSTTKFSQWWYDYRINYIDTKTFADYRTEYFKKDIKIKVIDRNWQSLNKSDPRALVWGYWYAKTIPTGHETLAIIPKEIIKTNNDEWAENKWSEKSLRKIKRQ